MSTAARPEPQPAATGVVDGPAPVLRVRDLALAAAIIRLVDA